MLSRGVSHPARLVLLRPHLRLSPPARARRMSLTATNVNANVDSNPSPRKMSKLTNTPLTDLLRVKKISEHATLPVRGSDGAAGYDLASAYDYGA